MFRKAIRNFIRKFDFIYKPYRKIRVRLEEKHRNKILLNNGYKVLNGVCKELKNSNIKIFCAYGTLLGFIRDKSFINHDYDIDMGIIYNDDFSWDKLDELLMNAGMNFEHQFKLDTGEITERTYIKDGVSIDFFLYNIDKKNNNMFSYVYFTIGNNEDIKVKKSFAPIVEEIDYKKIHNIDLPIIKNNLEYLEFVYGENWQVPDPNYKPDRTPLKNRYGIFEKEK